MKILSLEELVRIEHSFQNSFFLRSKHFKDDPAGGVLQGEDFEAVMGMALELRRREDGAPKVRKSKVLEYILNDEATGRALERLIQSTESEGYELVTFRHIERFRPTWSIILHFRQP